ncbi:MAG: VCBS repeat-containing protein [Ignavibacteriales bacterium]|nr:MAG: VCBS repeat-containing protein [Ignavibacteriales bacterium]
MLKEKFLQHNINIKKNQPGKITDFLNVSRIFLLIFAIVVFNGYSNAQWVTQSPSPTHLDVRGIGAPNSNRVFIATDDNMFDDGGSLFESNDGGNTWVQRDIPVTLGNPLNGMFFYNSQLGWVFGNENYRTTNGGTTWDQLPFLGSTYFMEFYTPSFGLTTGNFDKFISRDSGSTWIESPNGIYEFSFTNSQNGLGVSATGIYRTIDGGLNFSPVYAGDADAVKYLSDQVAVAIVNGVFVRSTDGGATWNPGTSSIQRTSLYAVDPNNIIAWGRSGIFPNYDDRILHSSDAGLTWNDLGEIIPEGIFSVTKSSSQNVIAADRAGNMFLSVNGGASWSQTFTSRGQMPSYLSSVVPVFADQQVGYFGYGSGFVIKTTDGGASWFQVSSGTGDSINDADIFPDGKMIAVGDNGTLLVKNTASAWIVKERFTTAHLNAVQVLSASDVIMVDVSGKIYKSSDGGESWVPSSSAPAVMTEARDISFSSLTEGWVIGQSFNTGALYHTTDGGSSWVPVTDFLGSYVSVDVVDSSIWAANVGGRYYRSTDGGINWIESDLPYSPVQIADMDFWDASTGYAVGAFGQIFKSNDGGATWDMLETPSTNHSFTDIFLLGENEFWISTNADVAYYSANGGQNWAVININSDGFGYFSSVIANQTGSAWVLGYQGYIEYFAGPPPPPANNPPHASFNFITSGLTAQFTDTSTDPDGIIVNWSWDFGDGNFSNEQNPSHTYTTANTYIVRLTVTDDDSGTSTAGRLVVVQPGPGGTFGDFTEVTPLDSIFITSQDEDFWVITTAPADYDNDGDLDVAVLGYYVVYNQSVEDRLILVRNDGQVNPGQWGFTYNNVDLNGMSAGSSDLSWGDADGDGDQDLLVASDGQTVLYINDQGSLNPIQTNLPAYWEDNDQADFDLRSVTWADYDNDGDADLLLPSVFNDSTFEYYTALMRNDGSDGNGGWIFTETDSVFSPTIHAQSSWADFDNDQDLDLLLVNIAPLTDEGFIRRYRNDGNGNFTAEDILGTLSVEHGEAQWGDYDGDGDLDILVAGNVRELDSTYTHMALRIYKNENETYVPFDVISCIPCEGWFDLTAATWADYDSDGDIDILLAGTYNSGSQIEGRARIYTNNNGVFTDSGNELPAPRSSGDRGGTFSWLDIDNDGDLDYFIAGQYFVPGGNGLVEAQMHVYRNDVEGQNSAPTQPEGLNAAVQQDSSIVFTWTASMDDHTPSNALTYYLELYRDNIPVTIPNSLPEPGNVSNGTQWKLKDLEPGNYKWMLRAVDAAYISSTSAFGEFSVGMPTGLDETDAPVDYSLDQNYPNPFNPSTVIKFSIPSDQEVTLKIYNALGQEVITLLNENKKSGSYEIVFNAYDLSSGVYFYRIQAKDFVQTRKMLLIK